MPNNLKCPTCGAKLWHAGTRVSGSGDHIKRTPDMGSRGREIREDERDV